MPPKLTSWLRICWVAFLALTIVGSLLPGASLPIRALGALNINDKVMHLGAYLVLAFLPALHERRQTVSLIAAGAIGLGVLLEYGQLLSPGRSFELGDIIADAAGVFLGIALGLRLTPILRKLLAAY